MDESSIAGNAGSAPWSDLGNSENERLPSVAGVRCKDIGGVAGTGKTTLVRQWIAEDPSWGKLCATTGIAAVNLDTATLHSTLAYFDTDSLRDSYLTGHLARRLHLIALEYRHLVIDEKSMLDAAQLDMIYRATEQANEYRDVKSPLGIVLVGDFAQLPPVKARWAFEAECWPEFERRSQKLTRIWRQDQVEFLDALNATRRGDGRRASDILSSVGVQWHSSLDIDYDGTTLVPKNDQVDRYNQMKLDQCRGRRITVASRRWGDQRSEWTRQIPPRAEFKVGCYVMILTNARIDEGKFSWVNGDCGHVEDYDARAKEFRIRLVRTGQTITLPALVRSVTAKQRPESWHGGESREEEDYVPRQHRDARGKYVLGQVEWYPIRLAYASTVHKSQGLSLDRLQVDIRDRFFAHPSMLYVALSRCRTLEGLRIVGQRERFVMHCNAAKEVQRWL